MYIKKILLRDEKEDLSKWKDIFLDWKTEYCKEFKFLYINIDVQCDDAEFYSLGRCSVVGCWMEFDSLFPYALKK